MQAQGYLQAIQYENQDEFWKETMDLARANCMDSNLAWMYLMLKGARGKEIFRRDMLAGYVQKSRSMMVSPNGSTASAATVKNAVLQSNITYCPPV